MNKKEDVYIDKTDEKKCESLFRFNLSKSDWKKTPLLTRINIRLFSILFPGVLKIEIREK